MNHQFQNNLKLRAVAQRVSSAEVKIEGVSQGTIAKGLVILFGVGTVSEMKHDEFYAADPQIVIKNILPRLTKLSDKILALRIFEDESGKMNLNVKDISGSLYIISQFTLFADCSKGNRPSFTQSTKPIFAQPIYDEFINILKINAPGMNIKTGKFAHNMQVDLCNDGPVTLILEA